MWIVALGEAGEGRRLVEFAIDSQSPASGPIAIDKLPSPSPTSGPYPPSPRLGEGAGVRALR